MVSARFDYAAPASLGEAVTLLNQTAGAQLLAGGQSLVAEIKLRRATPTLLVDLGKIREIRGITRNALDGSLRIGAMTTLAEIAADPDVRDAYPALADATRSAGDPQSRNRRTLGGTLATNTATADLPALVLVLSATINTTGPQGPRAIPAESFVAGASREPGEIITSVDLPATEAQTGSAYEKFKHAANGSALCGVAAVVTLATNTIAACSLAVTGVSDQAQRLAAVEAALIGQVPSAANFASATEHAGSGLSGRTDRFASGEYRAHLVTVLAERALLRAVARAAESL